MLTQIACPSCQAEGLSTFYEVKGVPMHDVVLMPSRHVAMGCPLGDITLAFCQTCGLISNVAFHASLQQYATGYEGTQSFSTERHFGQIGLGGWDHPPHPLHR